MIELTEDEIEIFGKPNFATAPYAKLLIGAGVYKDGGSKAEYEQAVFMHWASGLLKEHGENWRKVAGDILLECSTKTRPDWGASVEAPAHEKSGNA